MDIDLRLGNCLDVMREMEDNSVDSVVTDPPYGLAFMGKKWDYDVPSIEIWREVFRVLKPGGHLLSFAGSRTYHRMAINIEDAGFEIRDQIMWLYGSGFPKSHNLSKAIDKAAGAEREVIGDNPNHRTLKPVNTMVGAPHSGDGSITRAATSEAERWDGWGTALKPAHEPIVVARKPLIGTAAENVLKHGTGGINIDGCRVGDIVQDTSLNGRAAESHKATVFESGLKKEFEGKVTTGRFPANVILECICDNTTEIDIPATGHWSKTTTKGFGDFGGGESNYEGVGPKEGNKGTSHTNPDCPCRILDEQAPNVGNMMNATRKTTTTGGSGNAWTTSSKNAGDSNGVFDGLGGASRFFYCAKASQKERNAGLSNLPDIDTRAAYGNRVCSTCNKHELNSNIDNRCVCDEPTWHGGRLSPVKNYHPTVKPVDLMRYLCRLVTPPNGIVLDPFMGSGTTGIAACFEDFNFIGIEMDEDYLEIARYRIAHWGDFEITETQALVPQRRITEWL